MMEPGWKKLLQKRFYDILSQRYQFLVIVCGLILIVVSAFHFGEIVLEWSEEKYAAVFNSYSDNIAGRSYRTRLCLPVPIDVVYTWVNGSDATMIRELRRFKAEMERELNLTKSSAKDESNKKCKFSHCVPMPMIVLDPVLPSEINLKRLRYLHPIFEPAERLYTITSPVSNKLNYTVVVFKDNEEVAKIVNTTQYIIVRRINHTVNMAHITSDWTAEHSVLLDDLIIMSGFPHQYKKDELFEKIPDKYRSTVEKFDLYSDDGMAVLRVPQKADFDALIKETNWTIDSKTPTLHAANLVWDLNTYLLYDDVGSHRFHDNEELRYSLRSIEMYAPWVRHIFLVTNGQLPSWLNLDHPRLTIITHEELFQNSSHLPTFGSPAIESHLHRIPGLSDKFIYMNDDVMFGKEVWPDDFYTHSLGQKVYLSWAIPNCREGCPSTWIRDGYCDKACNNSDCEWDAGDCTGDNVRGGVGMPDGGGGFQDWHTDAQKAQCSSGCANNWVADRYCDQACNVKSCGFDAGDCGTIDFQKLTGFALGMSKSEYHLPDGETVMYFNLSGLLKSNTTIKDANYDSNDAIRSVAIALKFQVLTVLINDNYTVTKLLFVLHLQHAEDNNTSSFNFSLTVDTSAQKLPLNKSVEVDSVIQHANISGLLTYDNMTYNNQSVDNGKETFQFEDIPEVLRLPKATLASDKLSEQSTLLLSVNWTLLDLPDDIRDHMIQLETDLLIGDLTEKGFNAQKSRLLKPFMNREKKIDSYLVMKTSANKIPSINKNKFDQIGDNKDAKIDSDAAGQINKQDELKVDDHAQIQKQHEIKVKKRGQVEEQMKVKMQSEIEQQSEMKVESQAQINKQDEMKVKKQDQGEKEVNMRPGKPSRDEKQEQMKVETHGQVEDEMKFEKQHKLENRELKVERQGPVGKRDEMKVERQGQVEKRDEMKVERQGQVEKRDEMKVEKQGQVEKRDEMKVERQGQVEKRDEMKVERQGQVEKRDEMKVEKQGKVEKRDEMKVERQGQVEKRDEMKVEKQDQVEKHDEFKVEKQGKVEKRDELKFDKQDQVEKLDKITFEKQGQVEKRDEIKVEKQGQIEKRNEIQFEKQDQDDKQDEIKVDKHSQDETVKLRKSKFGDVEVNKSSHVEIDKLGHIGGVAGGDKLGHIGGAADGDKLGDIGGAADGDKLGHIGVAADGDKLGHIGGAADGDKLGHIGGAADGDKLGDIGGAADGDKLGDIGGAADGDKLGHIGVAADGDKLGHIGGAADGDKLGHIGGAPEGDKLDVVKHGENNSSLHKIINRHDLQPDSIDKQKNLRTDGNKIPLVINEKGPAMLKIEDRQKGDKNADVNREKGNVFMKALREPLTAQKEGEVEVQELQDNMPHKLDDDEQKIAYLQKNFNNKIDYAKRKGDNEFNEGDLKIERNKKKSEIVEMKIQQPKLNNKKNIHPVKNRSIKPNTKVEKENKNAKKPKQAPHRSLLSVDLDNDNLERQYLDIRINSDHHSDNNNNNNNNRIENTKLENSRGGGGVMLEKGDTWEDVIVSNGRDKIYQPGGFKWERSGVLMELQKKKEKLARIRAFDGASYKSRHLLDTFGDSLRRVNRLYNKAFGYTTRKTPAHMPHLIDKNIMAELQDRFPVEWDITSSHKIRSSTDMQFSFSYFYYLMGVTRNITAEEVFKEMDKDHSNVLSDREVRVMATRLYDPPLTLELLTDLEHILMNCSRNHTEDAAVIEKLPTETYYVTDMPQVTAAMFINCDKLMELVNKRFSSKPKYKFETVGEEEIAFKMIKSNVSTVVGQLDDVRRNPKKFVCLNDNIDHDQEEAKTVKAVLQDFYESMFPIPSQFELAAEYRNRFLHIDELREWRRYRDWLRFWTHIALCLLVIFAIFSYCGDRIEALKRRFRRSRRRKSNSDSSDSSDGSNSYPGAILTV